jgi:hypothetical protein
MQRIEFIGLALLLFCFLFLLCYRLTQKKRRRQHSIDQKLKRYPIIRTAWHEVKGINAYEIPGLIETEFWLSATQESESCQWMTPQGLAFSQDFLFISAYCYEQKHHSIISVLDRSNGQLVKRIILPKRPHVGGLVYDSKQKILWLTITGSSTGRIAALREEDLFADTSEKTGQPISYWQVVDLPEIPQASYLTKNENKFISGNFTLKGNGQMGSFIVAKKDKALSQGQEKKVTKATAVALDEMPNKIQSVAFYKDYLLAARSYGPITSELLVFDQTNTRKVFRIKLPPYLEQIVVLEDQLAVLFESGAQAYRKKANPTLNNVLILDLRTLFRLAKIG